MKMILTVCVALFSLAMLSAVYAGGPKESHPCYEVADCRTQTSRKAFSNCIKKNVKAANQIKECADFREDKKAYIEKYGIGGLEALFKD